MKKIITTLFLVALFVVGFTASDETDTSADKMSKEESPAVETSKNTEESVKTEEPTKSIRRITDADELRQAINNKIWTHTTEGDVWIKLQFVGNEVKQYSALSNTREWRYDGSSTYELSKTRSLRDGKDEMEATFMPKIQSLVPFELPVVFNFRNYHLYLNGQDLGRFANFDYEWD